MINKNMNNFSEQHKVEIKTFNKDNTHNITLLVSNILAISFLTYFVFFYMKNEINLLSTSSMSHSQAVLGVSEIVEIPNIKDEDLNHYVPNSMEVIQHDKVIQSEAFYSEGMSRALEDKSDFKGKVVVVQNQENVQ